MAKGKKATVKSVKPVRRACVRPEVENAAALGTAELAVMGEVLAPERSLRRAPRPAGCQRFVRREIAAALPQICAMLLTRTMEGDLPSLKLLLQMALETGDGDGREAKRSSGFARKMLAGFREWEMRETGLKRD